MPRHFSVIHTSVFACVKDERKVPRPVYNYKVEQKFKEWLAEHPDFKWVPKGRKEEIREMVMIQLLTKNPAHSNVN